MSNKTTTINGHTVHGRFLRRMEVCLRRNGSKSEYELGGMLTDAFNNWKPLSVSDDDGPSSAFVETVNFDTDRNGDFYTIFGLVQIDGENSVPSEMVTTPDADNPLIPFVIDNSTSRVEIVRQVAAHLKKRWCKSE